MDEIKNFIADTTATKDIKIIELSDGYYARKNTRDGMSYNMRLTDFKMKIMSSHYREDGIFREIVFIKDNKQSSSKLIAPTDMFDSFKSFLASCGNYCFWGNANDLTNIWSFLYSQDEGKIIYEPECIGWQDDRKLYMFENIAFSGKEILQSDRNGTFWIDAVGIKPRSISSKSDVPDGLPSICVSKTLDIINLRARLQESMDPLCADQCLGWACAVLYMEEIFNRYSNFPFLFLSGKRRSGKSTIAQWLMNLYGFESSGRMWSDTTPVAMSRYLGYYSGLPLWLDEYRNDSKYANKTGMLRNVYNRQSSGKGTRDGFLIREAKIRGTVIISGEETPDDNALMTRCIIVQMSEKKRTKNNFNWFIDNRELLSNFTYQVLINKDVAKFMKELEENRLAISKDYDERIAINNAIIATGFSTLFGYDQKFALGLVDSVSRNSEDQEEESAISVFFNDVAALVFSKAISDAYWEDSDGKLFIYFHGLYNEWAIDYRKRKGDPPFKLQSLRGYLTEEPGFVDMGKNHRMSDNSVRSCVVFDIETSPNYIKQLVKRI